MPVNTTYNTFSFRVALTHFLQLLDVQLSVKLLNCFNVQPTKREYFFVRDIEKITWLLLLAKFCYALDFNRPKN